MYIIGILAMCSSLTITFIGLPRQIISNYRIKRCNGIVPTLIYTLFINYFLWCLYGWTRPDYFLALSQTPGCILGFVIMFQHFYYKKRKGISP